MAAGDFVWFDQGLHDLGNKIHDLDGDTLMLAVVNNNTVPAKTTPAPHFGGTGTTNFAPNQVATGTSYTGPIDVSPCVWTNTAGGPILSAALDPSIAQDETGFTDAYWGILFNNTDVNKRALGYINLAGPKSIQEGTLAINLDSAGGASTKMLKINN